MKKFAQRIIETAELVRPADKSDLCSTVVTAVTNKPLTYRNTSPLAACVSEKNIDFARLLNFLPMVAQVMR